MPLIRVWKYYQPDTAAKPQPNEIMESNVAKPKNMRNWFELTVGLFKKSLFPEHEITQRNPNEIPNINHPAPDWNLLEWTTWSKLPRGQNLRRQDAMWKKFAQRVDINLGISGILGLSHRLISWSNQKSLKWLRPILDQFWWFTACSTGGIKIQHCHCRIIGLPKLEDEMKAVKFLSDTAMKQWIYSGIPSQTWWDVNQQDWLPIEPRRMSSCCHLPFIFVLQQVWPKESGKINETRGWYQDWS